LNSQKPKKDAKKKNIIATYSRNQVERRYDMDENIVYTLMYKEVNLSILCRYDEKKMKKLFHVKI
jgi:hypothetical protein